MSEEDFRRYARMGVIALVSLLVLLFIFLNTETVDVSFVFFSARISLIWVILLSIAIGWIGGPLLWKFVRRHIVARV